MKKAPQFFRRREAGEYLRSKFGFGSGSLLAKLACEGTGPAFRKVGTAVIYEPEELDRWALAKIGEPQTSTAKAGNQAA